MRWEKNEWCTMWRVTRCHMYTIYFSTCIIGSFSLNSWKTLSFHVVRLPGPNNLHFLHFLLDLSTTCATPPPLPCFGLSSSSGWHSIITCGHCCLCSVILVFKVFLFVCTVSFLTSPPTSSVFLLFCSDTWWWHGRCMWLCYCVSNSVCSGCYI